MNFIRKIINRWRAPLIYKPKCSHSLHVIRYTKGDPLKEAYWIYFNIYENTVELDFDRNMFTVKNIIARRIM